jgi:hypothetical protein
MNRYDALVAIVRSVPPERRFRAGTVAMLIIGALYQPVITDTAQLPLPL